MIKEIKTFMNEIADDIFFNVKRNLSDSSIIKENYNRAQLLFDKEIDEEDFNEILEENFKELESIGIFIALAYKIKKYEYTQLVNDRYYFKDLKGLFNEIFKRFEKDEDIINELEYIYELLNRGEIKKLSIDVVLEFRFEYEIRFNRSISKYCEVYIKRDYDIDYLF